jgi:hypothetical protein
MSNNYNMINCICNFWAKTNNEENYVRIIKTDEDYNSFKEECKKNHNGEPVYMEYYKMNSFTKPFFDIETHLDVETSKEEINDLIENIHYQVLSILNKHYQNKEIIVNNRPVRKVFNNKKINYKISFRFIVLQTITTPFILKNLVNKIKNDNPIIGNYFDNNIYREGSNKICMLGGVKPFNKDKDIEKQSPLKLYEAEREYNLFETSITYVDETYDKYLDCPNGPVEDNNNNTCSLANTIVKEIKQKEEHNEILEKRKSEYFIKQMKKNIDALSPQTATDYHDWIKMLFCFVNMGKKYDWDDKIIFDFCHQFSKKDTDKYDHTLVQKKIYQIMGSDSDNHNKVGYNYFKEVLKSDNYEYYNNNMTMTYYERKIEFEKEICFINNPPIFYRTPMLPRIINSIQNFDFNQELTENQLKIQKRNLQCEKKDKNGKWETVQFLKHWLDDPKRLTYEGLKFEPNGLSDCEKPYYKNLFNGYRADKIDIIGDIDYKDIQIILDHIKIVICDNNDEHYTWFMNWISRVVVDPVNKPQVGIVLYSKSHGTGKNSFTEFFCNQILGFDVTASISKPETIFGNFNAILRNCICLIIEEAKGDMKKFMEEFKTLVTEPTVTITKKGIDSKKYNNYVSLILPTNREDILDIDEQDRRCCILEVSSCKQNDKEYFNKLHSEMKKPRIAALFIKYLREEINCNWSPKDFQEKRPITKAYKKQQSLNAKNYMKYVSHIVTDKGLVHGSPDFQKCENWFKYSGKKCALLSESDVWKSYSKICENFKYTPYDRDKLFHNLTQNGTGIYKTRRQSGKYLKFIKDEVEQWVELFRNTKNTDIDDFDENLVSFEDSSEE